MLCWFLPSNKRIKHKYTYITSLLSLPLPTAHHPTPLDCHRAPGWAPCVIQQLPTYFTHSSVYILMLLESGFKWRFLGPTLQACESVCGGWDPGVSNISGQQTAFETFWTSDLLEGKKFSSPIFFFFNHSITQKWKQPEKLFQEGNLYANFSSQVKGKQLVIPFQIVHVLEGVLVSFHGISWFCDATSGW